MKQEQKELWLDNMLNSLETIQPVSAKYDLFSDIENRISKVRFTAKIIPLKTLSAAAASLVLLFALNVLIIKQKKQPDKNNLQSVVKYYDLTNDAALGI